MTGTPEAEQVVPIHDLDPLEVSASPGRASRLPAPARSDQIPSQVNRLEKKPIPKCFRVLISSMIGTPSKLQPSKHSKLLDSLEVVLGCVGLQGRPEGD